MDNIFRLFNQLRFRKGGLKHYFLHLSVHLDEIGAVAQAVQVERGLIALGLLADDGLSAHVEHLHLQLLFAGQQELQMSASHALDHQS